MNSSNFGVIALTALVTLGVVVIIVSAIWLTYLTRTQQGKHDALVSSVNGWFKEVTDHFNQKHNQLTGDMKAILSDIKSDVVNVKSMVEADAATVKTDVGKATEVISGDVKQVETKL